MEMLLSFILGATGALSSQLSDPQQPPLTTFTVHTQIPHAETWSSCSPRPCFPMCAEQSQCRALLGKLWGPPDKGVPCYTVIHPSTIGPSRPWQENGGGLLG